MVNRLNVGDTTDDENVVALVGSDVASWVVELIEEVLFIVAGIAIG